ncbi:MAG: hypothetical protein HZC15_00165 [Candidatus Omnitrophica bacterium]|nr:hypothetical protein [Candidatus Omnitrophota bacterium]
MPIEQELIIKEVIQRSYNVKSFRLEVDSSALFKAGQFLLVSFKDAPELKRYLSFSSSPTEKEYIEFTKKITSSDFSCKLNSLKPLDRLLVKFPMGRFTIEDNPAKKIAFLSGGIGITPIRSICKYIVDKELDSDLTLVYANRTIKDIIFREDFEIMQKKYPGLKVHHILCEASPGFTCKIGLINALMIKTEIPDYLERKFFLCGPPAMVEAISKMLSEELLVTKQNIVTENFQGY